MSTVVHSKLTSLPGTLQANAIYYVAPAAYPDLVEIYVTNATGTAHRHTLNRADVATMISDAAIAAGNPTPVADIAARDALSPSAAVFVYVIDASADATVASGGATYLWNPTSSTWIKTSEAESMDIALTWAALQGKPSSSAAAIDAAVGNSHTHPNVTQLNLIGQNGAGQLTYNGAQVKTEWDTTAW